MFSPYYAWARRGGRDVPAERHVAINIVLRGPSQAAWSMTERGAAALQRDAGFLSIGPSRMTWRRDMLTIDIDERGCPWPSRIRGRIRLHPHAMPGCAWPLDPAGRHWWSPLAPLARVEVDLQYPHLRWSGAGYLDSNAGAAPLEQDFAGWHWLRTAPQGSAAVLYDCLRTDGTRLGLALSCDGNGRIEEFAPPPSRSLGRSAWRIERHVGCEDGGTPSVARTLLDAPFYTRSVVETQLHGRRVTGIHESLSLQRFSSRLVQAMLAFRMPRRSR